METVVPLRTAWIADILSQASLRDVHRQRCWKRGSGDGQRRWDYDTTERSFNAISALCVAVERRGVGLWRDDGLMLSPIVEHTSVWEGVGGRGKIWRGIPQWNTKLPKDQLSKPQTATVATAQWPSTYQTTRVKEQQVLSKINIEKRNQINTKNYWK